MVAQESRGAPMLELNCEQRRFVAEALRDVANIAVGATLFGQFLADRPFSPWLGISEFVGWAALSAFATSLIGRARP